MFSGISCWTNKNIWSYFSSFSSRLLVPAGNFLLSAGEHTVSRPLFSVTGISLPFTTNVARVVISLVWAGCWDSFPREDVFPMMENCGAEEVCGSRGDRPGLHVPSLCGHKATLHSNLRNLIWVFQSPTRSFSRLLSLFAWRFCFRESMQSKFVPQQ